MQKTPNSISRARPSARREPMIASKYWCESQFEQKEENGENEEQEASSLVVDDRGRKDSSTSQVVKTASWTSYNGRTRDTRPDAPFFAGSFTWLQIIYGIYKSFKKFQRSWFIDSNNLFIWF